MSNNNMDNLIADLSDDLDSVKPLMHPMLRALLFILIPVLYVAPVIYMQGVRPDTLMNLMNQKFVFEIALLLSLFVSAGIATAWLCIPDVMNQKWIVAIPLTLLGVFVSWCAIEVIFSAHIPNVYVACVLDCALVASIPAAMVVFLTHNGASTHPSLSAFMGMLSVSALGYAALRLTCGADEIAHIGLYHILPFIALGGILGYIAQRLYRW